MDTALVQNGLTAIVSLAVGIITAKTTLEAKRNDLVQPVIDGYSKIVQELRADKTELQHQVAQLQAQIVELQHEVFMLRQELLEMKVDKHQP